MDTGEADQDSGFEAGSKPERSSVFGFSTSDNSTLGL